MAKNFWLNLSSVFSIGLSLAGMVGLRKIMQDTQKITDEMKALQPNTTLPHVTVLVPARNEEKFIETSLHSILNQSYPSFEVICLDDHSTDQTHVILAELARQYPQKLRVLNVPELKAGWLGKTNALWHGYQNINLASEWILFVDADTKVAVDALCRAILYAQEHKLDLFSFAPRTRLETFWGKMTTPETLKFYTLLAGNPLNPPKPDEVEGASAVGAFILVRRTSYAAMGGHASVKDKVIEDIELARAFRKQGFKTQQTPGLEFVEMGWYQTPQETWEGVGKNLFLVARSSWARVAFVVGVEWLYGLLPFFVLSKRTLSLVAGKNQVVATKTSWLLNLAAITSVLAFYGYSSKQLGVPAYYGLLYPFSAWVSSTTLIKSAVQTAILKKVRWKDRTIVLATRQHSQ
jgi:GT2 family glycosyltransferase